MLGEPASGRYQAEGSKCLTAFETVVSVGSSSTLISLSINKLLYRLIALAGRNQGLAAPAKDYVLLLQSLDFVLQGNDKVP